jgi:hypothetical protein
MDFKTPSVRTITLAERNALAAAPSAADQHAAATVETTAIGVAAKASGRRSGEQHEMSSGYKRNIAHSADGRVALATTGAVCGLVVGGPGAGSVSGCGAKNAGTDFYEDFRDKKTEDMKVIPARAESANFLQSKPEGLRITLPAGPLRQRETGVSPQFDISGDFEITAGYEIIEADQNGSASFEIYLQTNAPTKEALALHRTLGPDSSGYYFVTRMGGSELPPCPNL